MASRLISYIRSPAVRPLWVCYIGYTAWLMIGAELVTTRTMVVPVVVPEARTGVIVPTQVMVSLRGSRRALNALSITDIAARIDITNVASGFQHISLTDQHLLLPPGVSLVNYVEIPLFVSRTLS